MENITQKNVAGMEVTVSNASLLKIIYYCFVRVVTILLDKTLLMMIGSKDGSNNN